MTLRIQQLPYLFVLVSYLSFAFMGNSFKSTGKIRTLSKVRHMGMLSSNNRFQFKGVGSHLLRPSKIFTFTLASLSSLATAAITTPPVEYFRSDYKPLPYKVPNVFMDFKLGLSESFVTTRSKIQRVSATVEDLNFDGEDTIELIEIKIGDKKVLYQKLYLFLYDDTAKYMKIELYSFKMVIIKFFRTVT